MPIIEDRAELQEVVSSTSYRQRATATRPYPSIASSAELQGSTGPSARRTRRLIELQAQQDEPGWTRRARPASQAADQGSSVGGDLDDVEGPLVGTGTGRATA
ncbi:MAG: hypothetical protein WKF73_08325 [Nocardioidaceae bacterium]